VTKLPTNGRSVTEWVGKTPDSIPPAHVRLRVFERHGGICHIAKRKIMAGEKWELEHVKPLWQAAPGENLNRESNMAPALAAPHKQKTAEEASMRAKERRQREKHLGIYPKSKFPLKSRGFEPSRR